MPARYAVVALALCTLFVPVAVHAAAPAARVGALKGTAVALSVDQKYRRLNKGDPVHTGERVQTRRRASIKLIFTDGSKFDLGPDADMKVERYGLEETDTGGFATRIFKGAFRFVSGLIAKRRPGAMRVGLPVATIGIRGTQVVGEAEATSARVILLEPEEKGRKTSIEVSNQFGSVVVDEPGYGTEVPDAHSPPSPPKRMRLRTIRNLMRSMQTVGRISLPRPRMH